LEDRPHTALNWAYVRPKGFEPPTF
jgi:hypothetical protein